MTITLKIVQFHEPTRVGRLGSGDEPDDFFKYRLFARNCQRALIGEPVLLFGLNQKLLENRVVQVSGPDDEAPAAGSDTDSHMSGGYVGRDAISGHSSLVAPPSEHLSEPDNVPDFAAFSESGRHFWNGRKIEDDVEGEIWMMCLEVGEFLESQWRRVL